MPFQIVAAKVVSSRWEHAMRLGPEWQGSTYSDSTKQIILREIATKPGKNHREIAEILGLDPARVKSFLDGEGRDRYGLTVHSRRWYCVSPAVPHPSRAAAGASPPFDQSPQPALEPEPESAPEPFPAPAAHPAAAPQPAQPAPPQATDDFQTSVCASLAAMPILQATLKASLMGRASVERALAEPQFAGLDDRLKTELLTRMANLQASPQPLGAVRRRRSFPWAWLVILLAAAGVASVVINLSGPGTRPVAPALGR